MFDSSELIFKSLFSRISSKLIDEHYRQTILKITKELPVLNHGIIEFYDKPFQPRVDLMLCVQKDYGEHQKFKDAIANKSMDSSWKLFFDNWTDEHGLLASILENIYIVYDLPTPDDNLGSWPYLAFHKMALDPEIQVTLFRKFSEQLGSKLNNDVSNLLLNCFKILKSHHHLFGFGNLNNRSDKSFRIGISGFKNIKELANYLKGLKWEGDLNSFKNLYWLDHLTESFVLSLKMNKSVFPEVGLECIIPKTANREYTERFLNHLCENFDFDQERKALLLDAIGNYSGLSTWINHIKVNFKTDKISGFKTYLYYQLID